MISLRKNGHIAFNEESIERFSVRGFKYADLYYDLEARRIGIKLTGAKSRGSRKITFLGGFALVSATAFLNHFGIRVDKARKFSPAYDEKEQMIMLCI